MILVVTRAGTFGEKLAVGVYFRRNGNVVRNTLRETFTVDEARAAMGIDWMPMKSLSQAIPPAYGAWIGRQALEVLDQRRTR